MQNPEHIVNKRTYHITPETLSSLGEWKKLEDILIFRYCSFGTAQSKTKQCFGNTHKNANNNNNKNTERHGFFHNYGKPLRRQSLSTLD